MLEIVTLCPACPGLIPIATNTIMMMAMLMMIELTILTSSFGPAHLPSDCYAPAPRPPPGGELGHRIRSLLVMIIIFQLAIMMMAMFRMQIQNNQITSMMIISQRAAALREQEVVLHEEQVRGEVRSQAGG